MKKILSFLLSVVGLILVSCSQEVEREFVSFDEITYQNKKSLWEQNALKNYSFKLNYFASTDPMETEGKVVDGVPHVQGESIYNLMTINDVYKKIIDDINQAKNQREAIGVTVNVKYNSEYHYPEEINFKISYNDEDPMVGGPWYEIKISNFQVIK